MWINVDDYGMCSAVDKAVESLFAKDIIQSTSVMSTCASSESLKLLRTLNDKGLKVGVHLDLTDGTPLSSRFKKQYGKSFPTFQEWVRKDIVIKHNVLVEEWIEQISKVQDRGIKIDHIDFHRAYPFTDPRIWYHYVTLANELKLSYRGAITTTSWRGIVFNKSTYSIINSIIKAPMKTIRHTASSSQFRQKGSYKTSLLLFHDANHISQIIKRLQNENFTGELVSHAMVDDGSRCVEHWKVKEYEVLINL